METVSNMSNVWYLAGPMKDKPQSNIPLFEAAAVELRKQGYEIISPIELDPPETKAEAMNGNTYGNESVGTILGRDIANIIDRKLNIMFLPNWEYSRGARMEAWCSLDRGGLFREYNPETKQ